MPSIWGGGGSLVASGRGPKYKAQALLKHYFRRFRIIMAELIATYSHGVRYRVALAC